MADFITAYNNTAPNEGAYSNDPEDNGNWTGGLKNEGLLIGSNKGISAPVLSRFLKRVATVPDMKNISTDTAQTIYKNNYWDVLRGDQWNDQEKINHVYDTAINVGCIPAIKMWQMALGLPATGKMDDTTLNRTNLI